MAAAKAGADMQNQAYLPDFCAAGTVLVILLVSELIAIVLTLASYVPGSFLTELSKMSMYVLWIAFLSTAILCRIRPRETHRPLSSASSFCWRSACCWPR